MRLPSAPRRPELAQLLEDALAHVARMTPQERAAMYARQAFGYIIAETVMSVYEPEGKDPSFVRKNALATLMHIQGVLDEDAAACARAPHVLVDRAQQLSARDKEELVARIDKDLEELAQLPLT